MNLVRPLRLVPLLAASAIALAQDPIATGPTIYSPLLDNPRVRLMQAEFAPGASIGLHKHPDHAVYVLAGGTLHITGADGKMQVFDLKQGETVWLPAQSHSAVNPGKTTVRVLVIELKGAAPAR